MSKKKNELSLNYKVERSNELNKLIPKGWNLTEVRFLAIYQAKINARNPESRVVTFPLETFCEIMEIKKLNITQMKETVRSLLSKPVFLPNDKNGFIGIPLFVECEVLQDDKTNEWFVKIECHQKALPYMFEMKKNYFTYELWNALSLSSVNQIRMYEILKQYEKIGNRIIEVEELKRLLGIKKNQYSLFKDFRTRVLESCQQALEQNTDIKYTFEPMRKGRKIHALKFTITKNKNFKDDLKLKEFIKPEDLEDIQIDTAIQSLYSRCKEEYTINQLEQLYDYITNCGVNISSGVDNYIYSVYANIKISGNKINNLFKYTFSIIKDDINKHIFEDSKDNNNRHTSRSDEMYISSYDINEVVRNHKIEWFTQEELENENIKPIEPSKVEEVYSNIEVQNNQKEKISDFPTLEFKFFYDEHDSSYVSFTSCSRLQALLEKKYHKEDTYWLLEEPFTQEQVIDLIFKRHQVVVVPKPVPVGDFEEYQKNSELCEIK